MCDDCVVFYVVVVKCDVDVVGGEIGWLVV